MDIDDILADVSRDALPQEVRDLQDISRAWVAERVAPEILPYPYGLVDRVMERIRKQIELVEEQTGDMDPKTNFQLIVIQTELERLKFIVRSFLRARIAKLDTHQLHYLQNPSHLSPSEQQYLTAHQSLLSRHYSASFLAQLPPQLRSLTDTTGRVSMVDEPDAESAVFCRVVRDVGLVPVVDGEDLEMRRGDVYVVQWRIIKDRVFAGDIEMI